MTDSSENSVDVLPWQCSDPHGHVGHLLKSLMHTLRNATETAMRDAGLDVSMTHLFALTVLQTEPGLPGAQLARRLMITAQSMNPLLRALADAGLAEWRPSPTNLRAQNWFITAAGEQVLAQAGAACEPVFEQMQSQLDPAERAQLVDLLQRCIAGLNGG